MEGIADVTRMQTYPDDLPLNLEVTAVHYFSSFVNQMIQKTMPVITLVSIAS